MNLVCAVLLVTNVTVTSYRSVPNQTDDSPFHTSTGARVRAGGVAVSRDLLCGACRRLHKRCAHAEDRRKLHYGDWLYVEGYEFRQVNDVMGKRKHYHVSTNRGRRKLFKTIRQAVDIWVGSYQEEKAIGVRPNRNIWFVKPEELRNEN